MGDLTALDLSRTGYQVALVLAAMALGVALVGLWMVRGTSSRRPPSLVPQAEPVRDDAAAGADPDWALALSQSAAALQRFDAMQMQLRARLEAARHELAAERTSVGSTVELMKRAACEMRLPQTLFELYEGLRLRPRKSPEAQQEDLAWHRRVGVEPGEVVLFDEATRNTRVEFQLGGRLWRLVGRSYLLSRSAFDEITLFDGRGQAQISVRVRLSAERTEVVDASVQSYRPGEWVEVMVACRLAMDERREQLMLGLQYRDLQRMRTDFGLDAPAPAWGPLP